MITILRFLKNQDTPVYRRHIEEAVGFNITRFLMRHRDKNIDSLESLELVERLPGEKTWVAWRISPLGREQGEAIINSLKTRKGG